MAERSPRGLSWARKAVGYTISIAITSLDKDGMTALLQPEHQEARYQSSIVDRRFSLIMKALEARTCLKTILV